MLFLGEDRLTRIRIRPCRRWLSVSAHRSCSIWDSRCGRRGTWGQLNGVVLPVLGSLTKVHGLLSRIKRGIRGEAEVGGVFGLDNCLDVTRPIGGCKSSLYCRCIAEISPHHLTLRCPYPFLLTAVVGAL